MKELRNLTERTMTVHFKGGPLGGETRQMPMTGTVIRVPAMHYYQSVVGGYGGKEPELPPMEYLTEEYRLTRSVGFDIVEATWVHPFEGLIKENSKLKKKLAEYEALDRFLVELKNILPGLFTYVPDTMSGQGGRH
jgi:hypothetical protein